MRCPPPILAVLLGVTLAVHADADRRAEQVVIYLDDTPGGPKIASDLAKSLAARMRAGAPAPRVNLLAVDLSDRDIVRAALAAELRKAPAAILVPNSNAALVAQSLTRDVPVVFGSREDPVALGLVQSLARPGGNLTGFTYFVPIDAKRLEFVRELAPRARKLGIVTDRWWLADAGGASVVRAARDRLGFEPELFQAETIAELKLALATPRARSMEAWYVPVVWLPYVQPDLVVKEITAMRRPAVFSGTKYVEKGGLISYAQVLPTSEAVRLSATTLALVLEGVPPAEIPIERPKTFELAVNVASARELGLRIPDSLLKRADRVVR